MRHPSFDAPVYSPEAPVQPYAGSESEGFDEMYIAIDEAFDHFWSQEFQPSKHLAAEDIAERREKAINRERVFAQKVCDAVLNMATLSDGVVTILFDVDETIVKKYFTDTGMRDVVRPAFTPVIKALDSVLGDRLEIGLLTSRGQSKLDEELVQPTYLGEVIHKINPDFVISSSDGVIARNSEIDYLERWGTQKQRLDALEGFVDPVKVQEVEMNSRYGWFSNKLLIIQELVRHNTDRFFIFVEDLPCASVIDPSNPRARGVQMEDSEFFSV